MFWLRYKTEFLIMHCMQPYNFNVIIVTASCYLALTEYHLQYLQLVAFFAKQISHVKISHIKNESSILLS